MDWFRIKRLRLTSDKCAEELFHVVFWVLSYFKATFIEENEGLEEDRLYQLLNDRNYEMLLLSLWVMHTFVPSELLRDKVRERFYRAVRVGSGDIGTRISVDVFQQDLEDRFKAYTRAYDRVRYLPSEGVNEFGGMIAQVIQYGTHPSEPSTNVTPHEVSRWYFRTRVAINKWHNEVQRRQLVKTIEKYSTTNLSHL